LDAEERSDGLDEMRRAYAGRWVALADGRPVGQGSSPEQALQAARASRYKEILRVIFMPPNSPMTLDNILDMVRPFLPADQPVYVVGGAVRDAMMDKAPHDVDFALQREAVSVARRVADALGGAYYLLDEERGTGRVLLNWKESGRLVLDFALLRGSDVESDLRARDFTINAMAIKTSQSNVLIDPLGGAADLRRKLLRVCSSTALVDDPVRIIRGIRFAAELDFHIQPETTQLMRTAVAELERVSAERKRDEIFRILEGPQPAAALRALEAIGALPHTLPELAGLKGVKQSPPHILDVWSHTLLCIEKFQGLIKVLGRKFDEESAADLMLGAAALALGRYRLQLAEHLETRLNPNRSLIGLLNFSLLYHDAAKPLVQTVDEHGRIRAFGHEERGAELAILRGEALALSNIEIERVSRIIRNHMRIHMLARRNQPPSRRAIYRFFRDCGETGIDICLVTLADALGTFGHTMPQDLWGAYLDVVRALFDAWWTQPHEDLMPKPLLNGHQICNELGLAPGPEIGRLLDALREAQATGQVLDGESARNFIRARWKEMTSGN
jgi:poly(A) polymerase